MHCGNTLDLILLEASFTAGDITEISEGQWSLKSNHRALRTHAVDSSLAS